MTTAVDTSRHRTLNRFQRRAALVPSDVSLALLTSRAAGKSEFLWFDLARLDQQYGAAVRALIVRPTHGGLADLKQTFVHLCTTYFAGRFKFNGATGVMIFPNGLTVTFDQLADERDWAKFQGKSFSWIAVDEVQSYPSSDLLFKLRSCLRSTEVPCRMTICGNSRGIGHSWIKRHFIDRARPWEPFADESGTLWVVGRGTLDDNEFLSDDYRRQLLAATQHDSGLRRAWIDDQWDGVHDGLYFADSFDARRVVIPAWNRLPNAVDLSHLMPGKRRAFASEWKTWLAYDHGTSAPACALLIVKSPGAEVGGRWFPRDSYIVLDEVTSASPDDSNSGLGWRVDRIASEIKSMTAHWAVKPDGCGDPAIFASHGSNAGTISDEFKREGVYFRPAPKLPRVHGWSRLVSLLAAAGDPEKAGLYISERCHYLLSTLPEAPRCPRNPDDIDSRCADHALDGLRYGITFDEYRPQFRESKLLGV